MQDQGDFTVSFCPSFNSYSSDKLADIAAKVTREKDEENKVTRNQNDNGSISDNNDDDDFEFVLVRANSNDYSTINGSDEMEYPGFPLFNRDLLLEYENNKESQNHDNDASEIRFPLKKLFIDDRDRQSSSSSSEADELEGIVPGTYCVWVPPKSPSPSPSRCKKSNSTGSSSKQRWRLRDLLHLRRSSSDGKESFIFCNPDHNNNSNITKKEEKIEKRKTVPAARTGKAKEKVSAHEVFYVRNKALKEGDKRKSYLPYRQGLVGFFANVNGLGKSFRPL